MVQLQKDLTRFEEVNLQVVGISYDSVEILKTFRESNDISFPLLADEGSKVIREYGIYFEKGLPHPGTFVISKDGIIRDKLFEEGYRKRHPNQALLDAARTLHDSN